MSGANRTRTNSSSQHDGIHGSQSHSPSLAPHGSRVDSLSIPLLSVNNTVGPPARRGTITLGSSSPRRSQGPGTHTSGSPQPPRRQSRSSKPLESQPSSSTGLKPSRSRAHTASYVPEPEASLLRKKRSSEADPQAISLEESVDMTDVFVTVSRELEKRFCSEEVRSQAQRELVQFPPGDVAVITLDREHRNEQCHKAPIGDQLDPQVTDCYDIFDHKPQLLVRNHQAYQRVSDKKLVYDHPTLLYECEQDEPDTALLSPSSSERSSMASSDGVQQSSNPVFMKAKNRTVGGSFSSPRTSPSTPVIERRPTNDQSSGANKSLEANDPHFKQMRRYRPEVEKTNAKARAKGRMSLYRYFDPDFRIVPHIAPGRDEATLLGHALTITRPLAFRVQVDALTFLIGNDEPFFSSIALYDTSKREKISENFYFDHNEPKVLKLLGRHQEKADEETKAKTCVFTVTKPNENIYLVLRIEVVLHGDHEEATEPYTKTTTASSNKEIHRATAKVLANIASGVKLGGYRQVFAWAAAPLFSADGKLIAQPEVHIDNIQPRNPKESIYDLIAEWKTQDQKGTKKFKDLSGRLNLSISQLEQDEVVHSLLDPSLCPVKVPSAHATPAAGSRRVGFQVEEDALVREAYEFPIEPVLRPHLAYMNNLYVYPSLVNFNSRDRHVRTILVKMQVRDCDSNIADSGLEVIYGTSSCPRFRREARSAVQYHNKAPLLEDEFKIKLPARLTTSHHLLFTFYHVVCNVKKNIDDPEQYVGYAVVPLFPNNRALTNNQGDHHAVPVSSSKLEAGYLSKTDGYMEGGKPLFTLRFALASTVYPQDTALTDFLCAHYNDSSKDKTLPEVLAKLSDIDDAVAVQFLPVILKALFDVITKVSAVQFEAFRAMIIILYKVHQRLDEKRERSSLLEWYVSYAFDYVGTDTEIGKRDPLFPKLCWSFLMYLMRRAKMMDDSDLAPQENIFAVSWFVFDVIVKSIALEQVRADKLGMSDRSDFVEPSTIKVLKKLPEYLAKLCIANAAKPAVVFLNKCFAVFCQDLFSVCDRGHVTHMVALYCNALHSEHEAVMAVKLKFDFLEIVCNYEHYIPLNTPILFMPSSIVELQAIPCRHPLAYILIDHVARTLKSPNSISRVQAIGVLSDLLAKHDYDARYQSKDCRERVAQLYFPLLLKLIGDYDSFSSIERSPEEQRKLFGCVMYVLKSCNRAFLRNWWKIEVSSRLLVFYELLDRCRETFKYVKVTGAGGVSQAHITKTPVQPMKPSVKSGSSAQKVVRTLAEIQVRNQSVSKEMHLILLDVLEDFIADYKSELEPISPASPLMDSIFNMFLNLLRGQQSEPFLHLLFASLRAFMAKFRQHILVADNSYCSELCYELVRLCSSKLLSVRCLASTSVYLLLKHNLAEVGNFGRMSSQTTIALSALVSDQVIKHPACLKKSLHRMSLYALHEYSIPGDGTDGIDDRYDDKVASYRKAKFARGVEKLCGTLGKILDDTFRVNQLQKQCDEPEMISLLYFSIAEGYTHAPDLRVQWLQNLAMFHEKEENFAEAGVCYTHIATLVAEYLVSTEKIGMNPTAFRSIFPGISESVADNDEDSTCQSQVFSIQGFKDKINLARVRFERAEYYEYSISLLGILLPLQEEEHAYVELAKSHRKLQELWSNISTNNETRLFGKYFRIGFYGSLFDDQDGKVFLYKQPKLTHLFEVSERLKTVYETKLGEGKVAVWQESSTVDRAKLNPDIAYLQITHLEPYFTEEEQDEGMRNTHFRKNSNLQHFQFEVPFTQGGKAHGSVSEQYKRKTILTIEHPFPSMLTRVPILRMQEVVVTPIQNSIEAIQQRTGILHAELTKVPPNPKTLQQVLQGSVRLQVNAGAIEICREFLGPERARYPRDQLLELSDTLTAFLRECALALTANKQLIDRTQIEFHKELETGFGELSQAIKEYIDPLDTLTEDGNTNATDSAYPDDEDSDHENDSDI